MGTSRAFLMAGSPTSKRTSTTGPIIWVIVPFDIAIVDYNRLFELLKVNKCRAERLLAVLLSVHPAFGHDADSAFRGSNIGVRGESRMIYRLTHIHPLFNHECGDLRIGKLPRRRKADMEFFAVVNRARADIHVAALGLRHLHEPRFDADGKIAIVKGVPRSVDSAIYRFAERLWLIGHARSRLRAAYLRMREVRVLFEHLLDRNNLHVIYGTNNDFHDAMYESSAAQPTYFGSLSTVNPETPQYQ